MILLWLGYWYIINSTDPMKHTQEMQANGASEAQDKKDIFCGSLHTWCI